MVAIATAGLLLWAINQSGKIGRNLREDGYSVIGTLLPILSLVASVWLFISLIPFFQWMDTP